MSKANSQFSSDNDEQSEDEEEKSDLERFGEKQIEWEKTENKSYEVISQGAGGFDRVTRPDYKSAKKAAEAHESATGNFCEINEI